jgi:hypothetical protein
VSQEDSPSSLEGLGFFRPLFVLTNFAFFTLGVLDCLGVMPEMFRGVRVLATGYTNTSGRPYCPMYDPSQYWTYINLWDGLIKIPIGHILFMYLFLLSGIGLLKRAVWGYYLHLITAILAMALPIIGYVGCFGCWYVFLVLFVSIDKGYRDEFTATKKST